MYKSLEPLAGKRRILVWFSGDLQFLASFSMFVHLANQLLQEIHSELFQANSKRLQRGCAQRKRSAKKGFKFAGDTGASQYSRSVALYTPLAS